MTGAITSGVSLVAILLFVYGLWLFIFPILMYSRLGDILQELRKNSNVTTYIAKFLSYDEIYYCPKCLKLDKEGGKCLTCGQQALKKSWNTR